MNNSDTNKTEQLNETAVKCRFFAQYLGKTFINGLGGSSILCPIDLVHIHADTISATMKLKPIDHIEDEDAIEVAKMFIKKEEIREELIFCGRIFATCIFDNQDIEETQLYNEHCKATDYLRSKGYALPFMEYTVDDLVKMDWVQLG
ncbi:hypothetical protein LXD69_07200 [Flavobacterium sediminilitoris]|uniref:Uncharacterized protein n=1 Tax=Flavobacterium sediminilitoris TaxID=2024526 RepID=A0ABY4HSK0_9FLAO|nr:MULTISPECIES: hypothetical protein [Flavobacterium]UOX35297.1 hypothetical protein LXD69_07200 [Flavobacterium sediminilitoris]